MRLKNRLGLVGLCRRHLVQKGPKMSDEDGEAEDAPKKGSKLPLIVGLVLALVGGGGGFFAASSGMIGGTKTEPEEEYALEEAPPMLDILSFVALDPFVISLPGANGRGHLRFSAQLEVPPEYVSEVEAVKPRIIDVLNGYLRAVDLEDLEDPTALVRLRGQMLRRVQVVAGEGRVKDLLIMEFVLS